jgi:hypothetical protein
VIHISGEFFRFFNEPHKLQQTQQEEDIYMIDSRVSNDTSWRYLRGPFRISDLDDNLAYFFEDPQNKGYCVFRNCLDSTLNILCNFKCSYSSFLVSNEFNNDKLMVCIRGHFFIMKPNGQIETEVKMVPPIEKDIELEVEDVSDNLKYFVFKGVE